MVRCAGQRDGGLRIYRKTMPPAFMIKGDVPMLGSIYQYPSFSESSPHSCSFFCFVFQLCPGSHVGLQQKLLTIVAKGHRWTPFFHCKVLV